MVPVTTQHHHARYKENGAINIYNILILMPKKYSFDSQSKIVMRWKYKPALSTVWLCFNRFCPHFGVKLE